MAKIVVEIPEELDKELKTFPEINWSKLAREFFRLKVFELELKQSLELQRAIFEVLASKSKLTRKDALELSKKVNESMLKDLKSKGLI